jgi:tetratricopeptide (TPR) repeat protein
LREAKEAYEQALAIQETLMAELPKGNNSNLDLWRTCNNLASLLLDAADPQLRDPARALQLAKKAVELAPNEGDPWLNLFEALYQNGEWKGAIEAAQKSNQVKENGFHLFDLARAYWQLGDKEKAGQYFHQGVEWMDKKKDKNDDLLRARAEAASLLGIKDESAGKQD